MLRDAANPSAAAGKLDVVRAAARHAFPTADVSPRGSAPSGVIGPAWMQGFGKLKRLRRETVRVQAAIDREFEVIEPDDRR